LDGVAVALKGAKQRLLFPEPGPGSQPGCSPRQAAALVLRVQ
jgi:hypothetical protein